MSYIFGQIVDFNKNEALRLRLGNELTYPTVTEPEQGYTFFHSGNKKFWGWNGVEWVEFGGNGSLIDIVNPLDAYFGTRLTTTEPREGFYIESALNKATGYIVNNTNTTGNAAISGFRAVINSDPFGDGIYIGIQNNSYYAPWLRKVGLINSKNIKVLTNDNTGDIIFGLGNAASTSIIESTQDIVLALNNDRTVVTPSLSIALIDGESSGKVLLTREWIETKGTTGSFTTNDGKTVTVVNGLITIIV
jgi:hypothetical protein